MIYLVGREQMHETCFIMKWSIKRSLIIPCYVSVVLPYSLSVKKDFPNQCLPNQDISKVTTVTKIIFLFLTLNTLTWKIW